MNALHTGEHVTVPGLTGRWTVWSKASSDWGPGAYFIRPPGGGPGYAVIRAKQTRTSAFPTLTLISAEAMR